MEFVIQHNLLNEKQLLKIKEAVQDLPHRFVGLIPFSREITSNEPLDGVNYIPYGSTSFVETTYDLGWTGLAFDPDRFSYHEAVKNRRDMLNDETILPVKEIISLLEGYDKRLEIFCRPSHDLKQFSGYVDTVENILAFLKDATQCVSSRSYRIDSDTFIVVARPRMIVAEWRCFIVGGKVIDASLYRLNGELNSKHITDKNLLNIFQIFADQWLPHQNCVMDIASCGNGDMKTIEFNTINGSGFYDHDIKKVMTAWWKYYQ